MHVGMSYAGPWMDAACRSVEMTSGQKPFFEATSATVQENAPAVRTSCRRTL